MAFLHEHELDCIGEYNDPEDDFLHLLFIKKYGEVNYCKKCGKVGSFHRVKNRRSYQCPNCGFQVYPTKGTIFEKTTTPLTWWLIFIRELIWDYRVSITDLRNISYIDWDNNGNGEYTMSYKTALRMKHIVLKNLINKSIMI